MSASSCSAWRSFASSDSAPRGRLGGSRCRGTKSWRRGCRRTSVEMQEGGGAEGAAGVRRRRAHDVERRRAVLQVGGRDERRVRRSGRSCVQAGAFFSGAVSRARRAVAEHRRALRLEATRIWSCAGERLGDQDGAVAVELAGGTEDVEAPESRGRRPARPRGVSIHAPRRVLTIPPTTVPIFLGQRCGDGHVVFGQNGLAERRKPHRGASASSPPSSIQVTRSRRCTGMSRSQSTSRSPASRGVAPRAQERRPPRPYAKPGGLRENDAVSLENGRTPRSARAARRGDGGPSERAMLLPRCATLRHAALGSAHPSITLSRAPS